MKLVIKAVLVAVALLNVAAAPYVVSDEDVRLSESFAITVAIEGAIEGGFVAGHPGRASLHVENGEVVFTMGGQQPIAGIYRQAVSVRVPLAEGLAMVTTTYDVTGVMTLTVSQETAVQFVSGEYDPVLLEQLTVMEELVGGVACSNNFYVGDADAACMVQPFDGQISNLAVNTRAAADRVAIR